MIYNIGIIFSWISLGLLIFLFFNKKNLYTEILVRVNLFIQVFLFCLLEVGLFLNDFSLSYVANYSAKSTPPLYKFASLWGSLDGSILLWNLCLSLFMYFYLKLYKDPSSNIDIKIFTLIMIFFVGYTVFSSSPFAGCIELATIGCSTSTILPFAELVTSNTGRGPNPLLQNHPLMAIHPPMLYIGYVGMTMPFVAATSRLYSKKEDSNSWIEVAEKTTYIPWLFLTIGITLGAAWSYEVLGWGGYWAWDPVENVSFIPWLLATAFLHSAKIQKTQNTLLNWNYILVGLMFLSTLFGTFITRSGVLISVHAFSNGNIGTYLLFGMLLFGLIFIGIGSKNIEYFSKSKKIDNWFGKSGFFVYNNIFLFSSALVIFIGTIFPLIYETLYSRQITVGRAYYDILVGPLLLILLGLMIFSVKLSIKNLNIQKWLNDNVVLINIALMVTIFTLFLLNNSYILIVTVSFSFLLIFTTVSNFYKNFRVPKGSSSYWTGQIAHLGIGIFALGIILNVSQSFSTEKELNSFQEFNFNNETYFVYDTIEERLPEKNVLKLPISNSKQTKYTSLNIFKNSSQQAISSPAVFRSIINDIYITVKFINEDSYKLIVRNNYGVLIMWIGLLITSLSFIPRLRKNEV
ncbi:MAG: cytochrome c biogenesis protein CcsA [Candidatus Actinomarina sp.]|tara:strand:- start:1169 stop:3064 length:1896 start_codon:yes stop_codon:yes gene_type:complete